ncbi:hypothetical protein L798_08077 [Zootermopsis nevadensis]|uniref:Uncharacterized protein n=1 Tax=Zootermopsis nevadensis TaxID=136037 RepID=A0A067R495_ZOONE|nr:hypothetical protein L798_08077 [Zootermopsis nevadensis]
MSLTRRFQNTVQRSSRYMHILVNVMTWPAICQHQKPSDDAIIAPVMDVHNITNVKFEVFTAVMMIFWILVQRTGRSSNTTASTPRHSSPWSLNGPFLPDTQEIQLILSTISDLKMERVNFF